MDVGDVRFDYGRDHHLVQLTPFNGHRPDASADRPNLWCRFDEQGIWRHYRELGQSLGTFIVLITGGVERMDMDTALAMCFLKKKGGV